MNTSTTDRRCAKPITPTERRIAEHTASLIHQMLFGSGRVSPAELTPPPATPEALGDPDEQPPLCVLGQGDYTREVHEEDI